MNKEVKNKRRRKIRKKERKKGEEARLPSPKSSTVCPQLQQ